MAGLAAAGVLARRCEQVTLFERDPASDPRPRKGAPQGNHGHILLKSGEAALEAIFPGIAGELAARGSHRVSFGTDMRWCHHGDWRVSYDSPRLVILMQSRPFLESLVRERLAGLGNVAFRYRTAVEGIDVADGRVSAVRVRGDGGDGEETREPGDLIVDATGRGSRLPRFLASLGYGMPWELRLPIDLVYASRTYRIPADPARAWKALLDYHTPPVETRAGLIFPLEDDRWVVTLAGYLGDPPPSDEAGWLDFARSLPQPDLYEAIREAEPLSEIQTFRFPYARWTRYDKLRRFPSGLLPVGDTVCSFDPVYGQGMSVAAIEALALGAWLDRDPRAENPRPFLRKLARIVGVPWLLATSEDLRYPRLADQRPAWMPLLQRYTKQVFRLSATSPPDYDRLLRVLHLVAGPELLFHPGTVGRVLGAALRALTPGPSPVPSRPPSPGEGNRPPKTTP
jgi:2-polyprenyl-6-methoxyphenol hydroxylase-like FAD-dependent oxidoreductase